MIDFFGPEIAGMIVGSMLVAIVFLFALAARWLYGRWKSTFDGMYDDGGSVIADQGDDWAPAPITWPGNFIEKRATNDETRPAWHSAVGVEIATRGYK